MKIPDEVEFAKLRKKSLLDSRGWVTCLHCVFCRLTTQDQIYDDGKFYCEPLKKWKDADDLIEFRCQRFVVKKCSKCIRSRGCEDKDKALFCNKFKYRYIETVMKGRKRPLPKNSYPIHVRLEQEYLDEKLQQEQEYWNGLNQELPNN